MTIPNLTALDVADRVRELCPSLDPESEAFRDACEGFAASLNWQAPDYGPVVWDDDRMTYRVKPGTVHTVTRPTIDPRKFYGRRGGGVDLADIAGETAPDTIGRYDVKRGRSKNGPTVEVKRRRVAPVIGAFDRDVNGAPILATPAEGSAEVANPSWTMAQMLTRDVRRIPGGWSSADVLAVTNRGAALEDLPMLGTDAVAWAEVIAGDRSSRSPVAAQRSDLTGMAHHPLLGRFVQHTGANGPQTRLRWAPRLRITYRRRKSDPRDAVRDAASGERVPMICSPVIGPWWSYTRGSSITPRRLNVTVMVPATTVHTLVTAAADAERLHVGRTTVQRTKRADRDKRGAIVNRGAVKARTVAALDDDRTPRTAEGWATLAAMLNRGDRLTAADGLVTMTRQASSGAYRVSDKRPDGAVFTVRTTDAVGMRLATA